MAITQATSLADFSTGIGTAGAVLKVDNVDGQVGIGTTDPQGTLQVGIAITMDGTAGVITASSFSGSGGNLSFTGADISAATGTFTGNVSVGGTLTYEDVTNIDAVGVITARSDVSIADKIIHTGDTNTAIRFPAADTFTVETAGSERVRVGAAGSVGIGTDDPESVLHVVGNIPNAPMNFGVHIGAHSGYGIMQFTAATGGIIDFGESGVDSAGRIIYTHSNDVLAFQTGNSEALRIDSSGRLLIGETSAVLDSSNALLQLGASEGANMVLYRDDTSVAQNDSIGLIRFYSNAGSSKQEHARISATSAFTSGADDKPGNLIFYTTADGASSPTERLRIDSLGNIGVNQTSINSSRKVEITQPSSYTSALRINSAGSAGNGAYVEFFVGSANYKVGGDHSTNALLFKKDGTEYMRHDSSGRLLVSTTSSTSNIAGYGNGGIQLNSTTTAQACVNIIHRNNSANTHAIVLAKARDGAANGGRVQDDDDFGAISFQGFDGTGGSTYRQGAEIRGAVDGTPGNTDMPGRLEFLTTPDGSATPTERVRITSKGVITAKNGAVAEIDTLTSASTVTPDFAASCNFTLTLGHDVTLANPSNLTAGQSGSIFLIQDGTGSRTITFGDQYDFAGGTAPTLSTAASSVDRLDYFVRTSSSIHCVVTLAYS